MAEHVEHIRPARPLPIDQMKGAALPSSNSKAFMAAQKAAMKSIEESFVKIQNRAGTLLPRR